MVIIVPYYNGREATMGLGDKISKEVMSWGTAGIIVVIVSIILLKFKDVTGVTSGLNTTVDTFVSAFSEPKNWVAIALIAIVGFGMLYYFKNKKN